VMFSHDFSSEDGILILQGLSPHVLRSCKIIAKSQNSILSIQLSSGAYIIDSSNLLGFKVEDLFERFNILKDASLDLLFQAFNIASEQSVARRPINFPLRLPMSDLTAIHQFPSKGELSDAGYPLRWYANTAMAFKEFNCCNMGQFWGLCSRMECLHLAEIMKQFVTFCMNNFGLSPLHCMTLPQYAWEAAFKCTRAEYEYIDDTDIINWVTKGIRAGASFSNVKSIKCSSTRLGDNVSECSHIIELDQNSQYAYEFTKALAVGSYYWLDESELNDIGVEKIPSNSATGYIFEVDLSYRNLKEASDLLNDLPLAIHKRKISADELSPFQLHVYENIKSHYPSPFEDERLVLDFHNKKNYIVYGETLKDYLSRGMKIDKVWKVLKFKQKAFLDPFLKAVIALRKHATASGDTVGSNICKLMLCSIYGKFLSDSSSFVRNEICTTRQQCIEFISKHSFQDVTIINHQTSLFHFRKSTVYHNHNIISAFMILENSKEDLYRCADFFRSVYDKCQVIAGETDSLLLFIQESSSSFLEKLRNLKGQIDFSKLPKGHYLKDDSLAGDLGAWKLSELNIKEYLSIKQRLTSYIKACENCRGVCNTACEADKNQTNKILGSGILKQDKKGLSHRYLEDLLHKEDLTYMQSVADPVRRYKFHSLDVRRYFKDNSSPSLAFGHYALRDGENDN
jgi:hypothetical protein